MQGPSFLKVRDLPSLSAVLGDTVRLSLHYCTTPPRGLEGWVMACATSRDSSSPLPRRARSSVSGQFARSSAAIVARQKTLPTCRRSMFHVKHSDLACHQPFVLGAPVESV
jgi:hypothetical protein